MYIADCHNDTAYKLYFEKKELFENDCNIDIKKLKKYKSLLFFAVFMDYEKYKNNPQEYFINIYSNLLSQLKKNEKYIYPYKNNETFLRDNRHCAVITLEGGDFITEVFHIDFLKKLDIKAVTLTWNKSNKIASCCCDENDGGLTEFGKSIIKKMQDVKIIPDLSHASDKTFYDVLELACQPVFVTHSNSRKLCNEKRNITDEMFRLLIKNKGVCGLNFYSRFIGENANLSDLQMHIYHFLSIGGENNIALGSDFDGAFPLVKPIEDCKDFDKIVNALLKDNLNEEIIKKIMYKNVLRMLERTE